MSISNCRLTIVVTAIQFRDANAETAHRYSAKTFVEINTNQTRIRPTHLDAISYEILGETHPRAIAAQVILRANERRGSLYGFFNTNQTNRGVVEVPTVLAALKSITNLERVRRLQRARRGASLSNRCGYETLLNMSIDELGEAETLIGQGVICLERYFSLVSEAFQYDWPRRGQDTASSLQFAKMIAGFVKLLRQFIAEGLDWEGIQAELESIRTNVMQLRDMQDYDEILFDPNHSDMPDFRPSATDDYRFLNNNRENPTSIQDVITP